jgi:DNA-binding Lrp family transcriptional regulator
MSFRVGTVPPRLAARGCLMLGEKNMRAHIVITTEAGKSRDVARQIAGLPGVKMADACWGSRDVFAVVEVKETQDLNKLVLDKIQRLEGVRETNTHIALD